MARNSDDRARILQILAENPAVSYACKKVGLARATYYRWVKDNASFKAAVERALIEGRAQWNEVAEATLFKKVREGDMRAIMFYLTHNDSRYIPKRSVFVEPLSQKERREFERLMSGKKPIPPEMIEKIMNALRNYGIVSSDEPPS